MADNKLPRKPPRFRPKKTWLRPLIKTGQLFESNSLACGKNGPGLDACEQFPKTS